MRYSAYGYTIDEIKQKNFTSFYVIYLFVAKINTLDENRYYINGLIRRILVKSLIAYIFAVINQHVNVTVYRKAKTVDTAIKHIRMQYIENILR